MINSNRKFKFAHELGAALFISLVAIVPLESCAQLDAEDRRAEIKVIEFKGEENSKKNIFIFLDGTRNDESSKTNVRKLFEIVSKNGDMQKTAIYIEGVGSIDRPIFGSILGRGMESRILRAYEFIYMNYKEGDNLFIFGFSRGAHQARALAGILSYAGLPHAKSIDRRKESAMFNGIIDITKSSFDSDPQHQTAWSNWSISNQPILGPEIKAGLQLEMTSVDIRFLGVWDTVPGSAFKDFGECKEAIGFWKRNLHWLPLISKGERYKTDSYPPIRNIAHAVSLDEKRSKFQPVLLCPPINPQSTNIIERWFPGAHADVGGGYPDSDDLSNISLHWMIEQFEPIYRVSNNFSISQSAHKGLAHWSFGDVPANVGSICVDRKAPPVDKIHPSFFSRKSELLVPVKVKNKILNLSYPLNCSQFAD